MSSSFFGSLREAARLLNPNEVSGGGGFAAGLAGAALLFELLTQEHPEGGRRQPS